MKIHHLFAKLSIRRKLSFLIFIFIFITLFAFSFISYISIREANERAGYIRLKNASEQIASMLTTNLQRLKNEAYKNADSQVLKTYIQQHYEDTNRLTGYFQYLIKDSNTIQVSLFNADLERIYVTAKNADSFMFNINSSLTEVRQAPYVASVGKLYNKNNSVVYPVIAAIKEKGNILGYLVHWRILKTSPAAIEQLGKLIGGNAFFYIANTDNSLWSDMIKKVSPPQIAKTTKHEYTRLDNNQVIAIKTPVQNSHWVVAIELSKTGLIATANEFLKLIIGIALILLCLGLWAAWSMGKRISDPLLKLTEAATLLASGTYAAPVDIMNRYDELGKLSRTFNAMAWKVDKAKIALEKKAHDYKLLFHSNPMPMLMYAIANKNILDVNEAAIKHYGFTREEFLQLTTKDIRPEEDIEKYMKYINSVAYNNFTRSLWRHKKKNGTIIMVEIIANNIIYNDQVARLILINDVTDKLNAEAQLIRHRKMEKKLIIETAIQAQEQQREEIGKELHDNINQILASTRLYLDLARKSKGPVVTEAIDKSFENVDLAITEIRHLSKQLVTPTFDTSLTDSLRELSEEIQAITPITINLQACKLYEDLLSDQAKLNIYRIIQEQVNNILKHAAASHIDIIIETNNDHLHLIVLDDGIGFNMKTKPKGIGLRNIENRVYAHNGHIELLSQPGKGTKWEIRIPLTCNGD